jgi:predicted secreted protein
MRSEMLTRLFLLSLFLEISLMNSAHAAPPSHTMVSAAEPRDVLAIDATVSAAVLPDTAVITLVVEKQGADAAPLTTEVNQILARALTEAKATSGVQAATGNYNTQPRYDNKGQRNGWVVRAELILKAKEFGVLGTLAGKLAKDLQIAGNGFEISPELRTKEENLLIEKGIAAFRSKAQAATKAFGNASYVVREVAVGQIGGGMPERPKMMMQARGAMMAADASVPIEAGNQLLSLTVSGSVQMVK